jgi:hypothetical protein
VLKYFRKEGDKTQKKLIRESNAKGNEGNNSK